MDSSRGSRSNGASASQTTSRKQDETSRLKNVEDQLRKVLTSIERGVGEKEEVTAGKCKGECSIENIEDLAKRITTKVKNGNEEGNKSQKATVATSTERNELQKETTDVNYQRRPKKLQYVPLNPNNISGEQYARFYVAKFTDESKRFVNPYALIAKITEVTHQKPRAVTGKQ